MREGRQDGEEEECGEGGEAEGRRQGSAEDRAQGKEGREAGEGQETGQSEGLQEEAAAPAAEETEQLLSSEIMYQGPLFRVVHDKLIEPGGRHSERDVIRHNGSVVILAIDANKSKAKRASTTRGS